eukprot:TRINITY_DN17293_c0_g1_i1.p1 TRINITY_DN17293_c0_g1~~TRINITY_DN17293_c0_g1_i1.p1  ORF type:complete len:200 (-),score=49.03 TRINITY_DN17293_c0_g1_i1:56-610(-)
MRSFYFLLIALLFAVTSAALVCKEPKAQSAFCASTGKFCIEESTDPDFTETLTEAEFNKQVTTNKATCEKNSDDFIPGCKVDCPSDVDTCAEDIVDNACDFDKETFCSTFTKSQEDGGLMCEEDSDCVYTKPCWSECRKCFTADQCQPKVSQGTYAAKDDDKCYVSPAAVVVPALALAVLAALF